MAAARTDRASVGELGASNPLSGLCAGRGQIRSAPKPRGVARGISAAHAVGGAEGHAAAAASLPQPCCRCPARGRTARIGAGRCVAGGPRTVPQMAFPILRSEDARIAGLVDIWFGERSGWPIHFAPRKLAESKTELGNALTRKFRAPKRDCHFPLRR